MVRWLLHSLSVSCCLVCPTKPSYWPIREKVCITTDHSINLQNKCTKPNQIFPRLQTFNFLAGYNFVRILGGYVSPVSVVLPSKLLSAIIGWVAPLLLGNAAVKLVTDYQLLTNQGMDFGILPIGRDDKKFENRFKFHQLDWCKFAALLWLLNWQDHIYFKFPLHFQSCSLCPLEWHWSSLL